MAEVKIKEIPQFTFWYHVNHNLNPYSGTFNAEVMDEALSAALKQAKKEMFVKFDKYSCIKDDAWYLELKKKELERYG